MTKTPWFKASEHTPDRPGVYLIRRHDGYFFWREFDGEDWLLTGVACSYPSPACRKPGGTKPTIARRDFEWCGLTENPHG